MGWCSWGAQTINRTNDNLQEIQIIELHNMSWILIHGAPLLNYTFPWLFMHTCNQFIEEEQFHYGDP